MRNLIASIVERHIQSKLAASEEGGLYGHPKHIGYACNSAIKQVTKHATTLAKEAYAKNPDVVDFWTTHHKRADSLPCQILKSALQETMPKFASTHKTAGRGEKGMYGFSTKTVEQGLKSAADLRHACGKVAYNVYAKKEKHRDRILDFLKQHGDNNCLYSRLLVSCFPEDSGEG